MQFPYEYSYCAFDFCLIKKMCVRKQSSERVEGESKETKREGGRQSGRGVRRGLGEISSLVDEWEWAMRLTERCKHLHTLRQPWSMGPMPVAWRIRRTGRREGPYRISRAHLQIGSNTDLHSSGDEHTAKLGWQILYGDTSGKACCQETLQ